MCFRISQDKLISTIRVWCSFEDEEGAGRTANKKVLLYEGVERSVCFIQNFADGSTTPLPGRITGLERADIRLLPTTETKSSVWRKCKASTCDTGRL